jgi:hypothetical protein
MEALRTAKTEINKAVNDPTRSVTRKVVLLVTDGQPTALRRDSIAQCQTNPLTGAPLGGAAWSDSNGCFFVKRGTSKTKAESDGLDRFLLNTNASGSFQPGGNPAQLYLDQMKAVRNAARDEANAIRNLGGSNVIIFAIAIGEPTSQGLRP